MIELLRTFLKFVKTWSIQVRIIYFRFMKSNLANRGNLGIMVLVILITALPTAAQIHLDNASFEGEPKDATTPIGWLECELGTTPDILPGPWGVYLEPYDGNTYVGLITRNNGSWEAIGQRLKKTLKKGECYQLSLQLATSYTYAGHNEPIRLRIWGSSDRCERQQLLKDLGLIDHEEWQNYSFEFRPSSKMKYIIFEAYYNTKKKMTHNGNVLIDAISPIRVCPRA